MSTIKNEKKNLNKCLRGTDFATPVLAGVLARCKNEREVKDMLEKIREDKGDSD